MGTLKQVIKKIPFATFVFRALRNKKVDHEFKTEGSTDFFDQLQSKNPKDVFTEIYNHNAWRGTDSVSGIGSDVHQTKVIIQEIPKLFGEFNISTMLDIPCGDFHWMKEVNLSDTNYIGADIVEKLVNKNNELYAGDHIKFEGLNLIEDNLPKVDMIFCRDCLVHLSFADIFLAFENICKSGSKYLLTTTFIDRKENGDITTGQWRVLNLQKSPFNLPNYQKIIVEECTEGGGEDYKDKALGYGE